eukprot:g21900.t1
MALQAALAAFRVGQHDVLTKLVANYEGKSLDLSSENLGAFGASAVAKGLQVNTALQVLNLYYNNVGPEGAAAIADMLKVNTCLATLILYGNDIGDAGATAIAKALQNNTALTNLDGIENKKALRIVETNRSRGTELQELCSRGAARVGVVGPVDNTVLFEKGTNLQELVLQSSKIAHHSYYQELLFWKHPHLRRLRLNAIGLTDDNLSVLVSSEDGLTFLEELDLRSNQLTTVPAELGDPKRFGKLHKLLVSRNAELLKRDDELGRRARSDVNVLGVDAGIQVLQLLRLGSSKLKQIPRTLLQLVTVGNFKVGKSTLLERGWLAPSLKRNTAKWSRLERTTSALLFNCLWRIVLNQRRGCIGCALDSLGAYHRACCTVLVCTHQDQLEQPKLQRTQEWLQELAPRLSSEFKHAHLDASGMLVDCETEKAPAMLEDLRKRVARAGRNLLSNPDLANVPEFLVVAQDGLAKWRNKHLTKWHASYAEALEIVKSLLPTSAPELVLRELIYQGDVMGFGTELVLSPVWLALALASIVRPHGHPFDGLKTNRGAVSRQDIQKALLEERWPASMVPTLSEQEASEAADDAAIDAKKKAKRASQADRRKSKMSKCEVCNEAWTLASIHHYCHECNRNVCSDSDQSLPRKKMFPQVLRFLQVLDVIAPLSHRPEPLSAATPAPELTEDSQAAAAPPPPLFRQPSFDISSAEQIMIPSSVGERYSGVIFAPRGLGFGFGERCLAAGVNCVGPPLLSKKLGPERSASYFGTHEFCFQEEDLVRVVLDEQGRDLFLCVADSKGFLCHYASSFVQEVLTVLRLPRWGRAEESACVAHLLCQNCLLKGRGPATARDTSQASNEICEVLDEQPWATGREGLSVLWGLSRHHNQRGQQAKAGKGNERGLDLGRFDFCTWDRKDEAMKDPSVKEIVAKVNSAATQVHGFWECTPIHKQASVKEIAKRLAQSSVLAAPSTSSPPAAALPATTPAAPSSSSSSAVSSFSSSAVSSFSSSAVSSSASPTASPARSPGPRAPPPSSPPASSPSTSLARPRALFPSSPPAYSSSSSSSPSSPSSAAPFSAACGAFTPAGPSNAARQAPVSVDEFTLRVVDALATDFA